MNDQAAIDVLIPAFNAAATIAASVGSIQSQSFSDIRIIVVDDGSTDDTPRILAKLAASDPRLLVVSRPNGGIVEALNTGLALCTAELIARHDADDLAFPSRLEEQRQYLLSNPDCVALDSHYWHIDGDGRRTELRDDTAGDVTPDPRFLPTREPYLMHPFLMVRTAPVQALGGYRYVFHSEDTDLYWRLLPFGRLHHLPSVLGEYRIHAGSISSASILNGRIAAVNSQLAALSYERRVRGADDLSFSRDLLPRYHRADTLDGILTVASEQLDPAEIAFLRVATCAKLLELGLLRPYLLADEDIATIVEAVAAAEPGMTPPARQHVRNLRTRLTFKLARKGHRHLARALSPGFLPVARFTARKAVRKLRSLIG